MDDLTSSLSVPLGTISAVEPLVVHHQALVDLEAHAAASRAFAFGVLYGEIYRCPRLHMNYVLVEGVHRGSLSDAPPNADMRTMLASMVDHLRATGVRSVGWYRTGAAVGLHLSPPDVGMHVALFPEPWSVAFVRDALIVRSTAVFMRLVDRSRPYPAPFYEQFSAEAYGDGERPRTAVAWSSYHTMTSVSPPEMPNAPLPLFDARKIRRAAVARPAVSGSPQTARVKPFEPVKTAQSEPAPAPSPAPASSPTSAPSPAPAPSPTSAPSPEPAPSKAASPAPAEPDPRQSIDRIFDPPDIRALARIQLPLSPRRRLVQRLSFRPRAGLLVLTIVAVTLAILAAWRLTH